MLAVIRNPIGPVLAALLATAGVIFALSSFNNEGSREADPNRRVREIRASSAPLLASDLAAFIERRRRSGLSDADPVAAWLSQFPRNDRGEMRDWLDYHDARIGVTATGYRLETSSGPGTDGWFRVEVDRRSRRVSATCGGEPAPGCASGRWRLEGFGHASSYLLGENGGQ